ncbi:MAG: hypothetical protein V9G24_06925 [Rhodoblastus sp.]
MRKQIAHVSQTLELPALQHDANSDSDATIRSIFRRVARDADTNQCFSGMFEASCVPDNSAQVSQNADNRLRHTEGRLREEHARILRRGRGA